MKIVFIVLFAVLIAHAFKPDLKDKKRRIGFVTVPFRGDANAFILLASELTKRNHTTYMFLPEDRRDWLNTEYSKGVNFVPSSWPEKNSTFSVEGANRLFEELTESESAAENVRLFLKMVNYCFHETKIVISCPSIQSMLKEKQLDLLIVHPLVYWLRRDTFAMFRKQYGVPLVILAPMYLVHFLDEQTLTPTPTAYVAAMDGPIPLDNIFKRALNLVLKYGTLASLIFTPMRVSQLDPKDPDLYPLAVIGANIAFGYEVPRPVAPFVHLVGGFIPEEKWQEKPEPSLKKWLDKQLDKSVLLVALGTLAAIKEHEWVTMIDTFRGANYSVLLVVRKNQQFKLPDLPPNVRLESHIAQLWVLRHPALFAFISHCGANSLAEAIYYGVKVICVPLANDAYHNAKLAQQAGVAVYMQRTDISKTTLQDAISFVRNNPQMDYDCARMSLIYREAGGLKKAVQVIESALKLGNSHLLPHSYKLNWYQAENYDAVLLLIVMMIILIWIILARRGFGHCCKKLKTN